MIIANMATFPARESILPPAVEKLLPQVDCLNLCLNEFKEIPKELAKYEKLNPFIPDEDYKDVGKFVPEINDNDYIVLVDDDIIYPDNYVETLHEHYIKYQDLNAVVGTHGTIYPDVYNGESKSRKVFAFRKALARSRVVNQLGTGTAFLKGHQMPSLNYMNGSQKYVDVRFSRYLFEHNYPLVCIPRGNDWMDEVNLQETIFNTFTKKWPIEVIREVQKIAGYSKLDFNTVHKVEL